MAGINRFVSAKAVTAGGRQLHSVAYLRKCVFISHKREDSGMARDVADSLVKMNVDVWLDLDEIDAVEPKTTEEHLKLTYAIEEGLRHSSHLLALISPRTRGSWWVPFEIGSCRARSKGLAFLVHKGVKELPSYLKLGESLEDKYSFLSWAKSLSATQETADLRAAAQLVGNEKLDLYLPQLGQRE